MPGTPPKNDIIQAPEPPLPDATKAEQEEGKKAQENATNRLKAEQEAGAYLVQQNSPGGPAKKAADNSE